MAKEQDDINTDEFINSINQAQSSWIAGRNFPKNTTKKYLKGLCGTTIDYISKVQSMVVNMDREKLLRSFAVQSISILVFRVANLIRSWLFFTMTARESQVYKIPYEADKKFGRTVYSFNDHRRMQTEMVVNEPIHPIMVVYEDFYCYKNGVYIHTKGNFSGYHSVRIIGWSVDAKLQSHLLGANSWGVKWGLDGFFRS
ncbi:Peptidase C1 and/or Propeptide C1 domain containing protein [Asbolus verrucosus]|uniref:Peptidase C1 and/or Propeptide C1 domain containing protein n=1 Tax=Asbolus verrucosus TaxID=1661398 RepID=A0A482VVB4_ASBVE|nr:Peptidase C1 and/or Propeptide C1 domain containing protein [Asbolus verrucosus]